MLGAALLDYYGVVGVRLEEKAGVRELQVPGREAPQAAEGPCRPRIGKPCMESTSQISTSKSSPWVSSETTITLVSV